MLPIDVLLKPTIGIPIVLLASYVLYSIVFARSDLPDLPWIGEKKGHWFSKTRAKIAATINYRAAIKDAYENVGFSLDYLPVTC